MVNKLLMILLFWVASIGAHAKNNEAFIELEKTDQIIEFEVEFAACGAKTKLKIQDGSMGILKIGDSDVVRFVVKKEKDGDIKLFPVKKTKFKNGNNWVDGLLLQEGVSILQSVSVAEMTRAGIKSVAYHGLYRASASTQTARASGAANASGSTSTNSEMRCCTWNACRGQVGMFCTTGSTGCGGDGCGSCCVSGGGTGGGGFPEIP